MMMQQMQIQIPSEHESIRLVENFIDQVRLHVQLDENIYGNVLIALTEAVNNAILHGNKLDKSKSVFLNLQFDKNKILFTVIDQGEGFDFENVKDPTSPENIEQIGGRGIFILKNLADEVEFSENGTKLSMSFFINEN